MSHLPPWGGILVGARLEAYSRVLEERERGLGAFLELDPRNPVRALDKDGKAATGALAGLPFAVKDNIAVEGMGLSCGSRILDGFRSPYSATCVRRLLEAGAACIGKTNLDEFGMGSSTENSAYKPSLNPWDRDRVPGGSSGGSAAAVAAGMVPFALGTDTGGSVRQPAAFCGLYGLKPTYGAVSRFGLVAYASSLETAGVMARTVDLAQAVFVAMAGRDPRDRTSVDAPGEEAADRRAHTGGAAGPLAGSRIAVPSGSLLGLEPGVERGFRNAIDALRDAGAEVVDIELPSLAHVVPAYYVIATAEASANLARFTGISYGARMAGAESHEELVLKTRSAGFGDEVKLRILLGTYVLRSGFQYRYYHKAQKLRSLIAGELAAAALGVDAIASPVFPTQAFRRGDPAMDPFMQKLADRFTCAANLAGLPALAMPSTLEGGLPTGIQLMGRAFGEDRLFAIARVLADHIPPAAPPLYSEECPA